MPKDTRRVRAAVRLEIALLLAVAACSGREPRPPAGQSPVHARARGNEPFWAVDVAPGNLVYKTPELLPDSLVFAGSQPLRAGDTLTWATTAAGRTLTLRVVRARCEDTMSGQEFGWMASMTIDSTSAQGCADVSESGPLTAPASRP